MTGTLKFGTAISCIDGRFLVRTIDQIELRLGVRHVDLITTAGAVKHLSSPITAEGEALLTDAAVSVTAHGSRGIAVVAHGDCAGNPVSDKNQKDQLEMAVVAMGGRFGDVEVSAFFLDPKTGFQRVA